MQTANAEIRSALSELQDLPTPVADWRVETGTDSGDEFAVWVWAVLENKVDLDTRIRLRDFVSDFIRNEADTDVWVYVNFRTASDAD